MPGFQWSPTRLGGGQNVTGVASQRLRTLDRARSPNIAAIVSGMVFTPRTELYPVATHQVNLPNPVLSDAASVAMSFDRAKLPASGLVANVSLEASFDGGASWIDFGKFSFDGGTVTRNGQTLAKSFIAHEWPGENDGAGGRRVVRPTHVRSFVDVQQAAQIAVELKQV